MADELVIVTETETNVVEVLSEGPAGPQGPPGVDGNPLPRVLNVQSVSSISPNMETYDQININLLSEDLYIHAPAGTAVNGQKLLFRIKDNGISRQISWNLAYRSLGISLPGQTVAGKTTYVGCVKNTEAGYLDVIAVLTET